MTTLEVHVPRFRIVTRTASLVRRTWMGLGYVMLVAGIAAIAIVTFEWMYRVQGHVRRAFFSPPAVADTTPIEPYDRSESGGWWPEFVQRRDRSVLGPNTRYDPYRGWQIGPAVFPGLSVDSSGRRLTIQRPVRGRTEPIRVFTLGGSTMWGFTVRDSSTIPSLLALRLGGQGLPIEVTNHAQSGFNLTQGVITLVTELRAGNTPDAVIFLDGVNEIGPVYEGNQPGGIYKQDLFARYWKGGPSAGEYLAAIGRQFEFVTRLQSLVGREATPAAQAPPPDGAVVCPPIATYYRNLVHVVQALSREYDFTVWFFWQPMLARSGKTLSPWEQFVTQRNRYPDQPALMLRCSAAVDSMMAAERTNNYFSLRSVFDHDTLDVFLDEWGHLTERGDSIVAERIAEVVTPALRQLARSGR